jgi:hypothetical protein
MKPAFQICLPCLPRQWYCVQIHYRVLVWTPCLMHRCVYLTVHITKLQLQNLSIYHILHVSIGTLATENLWCLHCLWPLR